MNGFRPSAVATTAALIIVPILRDEQEVMFLRWSDVNFELRTVRVTSKPELGFYPKRWEDREIPAPVELIDELRKHAHRPNCQFVFPSPAMPKATTTGMPSPMAATMSSGTRAALAVV